MIKVYIFLCFIFQGLCKNGLVEINGNDTTMVSTPHWPEPYPANTHCQWLVVAEVGYHVIITFLEFDLEQDYDYLHIGNGRMFQNPYLSLTG